MRKSAALVASLSLLALSNPRAAELPPQLGYSIALRNDHGVETQALSLPVGGDTRQLKLVGGVVEVTPPAKAGGISVIKLFADGKPGRLLHTARISRPDGQPVRVAYSLCGGQVGYQSPAPDKLDGCAAGAN
ncbi:hypothetical protein SAMN05216552_1004164 [Pseudoduganella namucuonensis]|uniref:Uncharacterized protein n=2 Tax=Pseudoduganella namucuonensis TaxID=1035707 RepID=A0A1I7GX62_9BURK|nr:hypothetical protein SAMN05216552_1004164 [Pseudoduganella namucuonensis]